MPDLVRKRIESIDLLRGTIMIIMALDHVRDYFYQNSFYFDPADLQKTNPVLFFTRWITHFCAPLFVFLSGTSAFLSGRKKTKKELSLFLLKRGCWLILLEHTVANFAWFFNPHFRFFAFGVLWALGASMVCLAALVYLPRQYILVIGLLLTGAHNALDNIHVTGQRVQDYLWGLLHERSSFSYHGIHFAVVYPLMPWIGVMALGYWIGNVFLPDYTKDRRSKFLMRLGIGAIALFVLLRLVNHYGDLAPWEIQRQRIFTIMSFLNVTKYPPSLDYVLITVGLGLIFLALTETHLNRLGKTITVYGRVPMFYYLVHLYAIHLGAMLAAVLTGYKWTDMTNFESMVFRVPWLKGYGFSLAATYAIWITLVILLYPLCKWYDRYKMLHKDKWWLSYL